MNVAPKMVSARVVKTRIDSPADAPAPASGNSSSAPSDRPSQLRCAVVVVSDQSIFDLSSRSASSRGAYSVIRKNHCSSVRCSTTVSQRSQRPLMTCSLASTVMSLGHQLTAADFL